MSHYDTLGVDKNADRATIKRAYRRKSRDAHPDRNGGDHRAMVAVNRAYDTLSDPDRRAHYDKCGEDRPPPPPIDITARTMIMTIFMQLFERGTDHDNLVSLTGDQVRGSQEQARHSIKNGEAKIAKLEKARTRLKYRGSERNFLDDVLTHQVTMIQEQIDKATHHIQAADRALELLREFEYQPELIVPKDMGGGLWVFMAAGGTP